MENKCKNLINNNKGVSLMEIAIALLILAFAFLPIIGVIGTSTKDTDVANSYVFAQTTARNILDTLLDDVPFNSINADSNGGIAELQDYNGYDVSNFLTMIGSANNRTQGQLTDERGINYQINIFVYPISANNKESHDVDNELLFVYLPRPKYEGESSEENDKWYTFPNESLSAYKKSEATDPYTLYNEGDKQIKNAYELGVKLNNSNYYVMKKILFQMTWKGRDGQDRRLEVFTMKANLDSDGKPLGS